MNILWSGGEDIDFPTIGGATVWTTPGYFRSGWARCGLRMQGGGETAKSLVFSGGAVTSAWLSYEIAFFGSENATSVKFAGFGLSGTDKSLGVGSDASNGLKFCIYTWDGTTRTELASEVGASIISQPPASVTCQRLDIQLTNYGATATVNVYLDGVSLITYTGDVTISGVTGFDSVFIHGPSASSGYALSELVVADADTRALLGLQTMALTGAGTINNWTNNTYTNVNGIAASDASATYVNTTGTDQQYTITDPTPSVYTVVGTKISARMAVSAGAVPTDVKLGWDNGGSVGFGPGASKALTSAYATYEQYDAVDPTTGNAFLQGDMAALQVDLESA